MNLLDLVVAIDVSTMQFIVEHRTALLTKISTSLSGLGTATTTASILGLFYLAEWTGEFWNGSVAHLADALAVAFLMETVQRGFPSSPVCVTATDPLTTSFPSGHAAAGMVFAFVAWRSDRIPALPVVLLALGMSASRVYLGTHYLSDTVFGTLLGLLIAWTTYRLDAGERTRRFLQEEVLPVLKSKFQSLSYGAEI